MTDRAMKQAAQILVIKHGALGDFVQALGPCAAIRAQHPQAHITCLTAPAYCELAKASGYFDEVWMDARPKWWRLPEVWPLVRQLRSRAFEWVYDLQTSERTGVYHRLMHVQQWSGIAAGCSHPDRNPRRFADHTLVRQRKQLHQAGIVQVPASDLSAVQADISHLKLPQRYAVLFAGCSAHRHHKRWPVEGFVQLGKRLLAQGILPVFDGTQAEASLLAEIAAAIPQARVQVGETSIIELIALARGACLAVGGDTGPMHIAAVVGCPSVVLLGDALGQQRCAPAGVRVQHLLREPLSALPSTEVWAACQQLAGLD